MVTIRQNTFETNSSSVHCLVMCNDNDYTQWLKGEMLYCDTDTALVSFDDYFDDFIAHYIHELDEGKGYEFEDDEELKIRGKDREDILLQVVNLDRLSARDVWDRIAAIRNSADYESYEDSLDPDEEFTPEGFFENSLRLDGLQSYEFFMNDEDYEHHFESKLDTTAGLIHAFGYAGHD